MARPVIYRVHYIQEVPGAAVRAELDRVDTCLWPALLAGLASTLDSHSVARGMV